jgi:hypothetical protein
MRIALLVGIDHYDHPAFLPTLYGCENDVKGMKMLLTTAGFECLRPLVNGQATAGAIRAAFMGAVSRLHQGDQLVFCFSGHGTPYPKHGKEEAICPVDFDWTRDNAIVASEIMEMLQPLHDTGARVTIVADCCYAAGLSPDYLQMLGANRWQRIRSHVHAKLARLFGARIRSAILPPAIAAELDRIPTSTVTFADSADVPGVVLVSACATSESNAQETRDQPTNGVLTRYLLQQLNEPGGLTQSGRASVLSVRQAVSAANYGQSPELHGDHVFYDQPLILSQ